MPSKFRRKKAVVSEAPVESVAEEVVLSVEPQNLETESHVSYDIILDKTTNKYLIVSLKYNLDTKEVNIASIKSVSRSVALTFQNHKRSLMTLAKIKE